MGLGGLFVPIHGVHVGKRRERSPIHVLVPAADEAQRPPRTSWKAPGRTAAWRRGEARPAASRPKQTPCVQAEDAARRGRCPERQGGPSATGPLRRASPPLALALSARVPEAVGSEPA